ncbi:MAG: stage II sporulation protein M, partial [Chloroflexi bacterium]|nr:stage II sporulation protein M [Chloroflexota bacterium]
GEYNAVDILNTSGAALIWLHNLRAISLALAFSIVSFGVLGVIILMLPMVLIGYFIVPFSYAGLSPFSFIVGLILPHGILEIPIMIIMGAVMLQMGARIVAPSQGRSIGEVWLQSVGDWAKLFVGLVVPVLAVAALLEVFVTPRVAFWLLR